MKRTYKTLLVAETGGVIKRMMGSEFPSPELRQTHIDDMLGADFPGLSVWCWPEEAASVQNDYPTVYTEAVKKWGDPQESPDNTKH